MKDAERNRLEAANELKAVEEKVAALRDQGHRDALDAESREMKRRVDMWSQDEAGYRAADIAADNDLKAEQAKLTELQQRLDGLERQLESYAAAQAK